MIKLVSIYHKDLLSKFDGQLMLADTHLYLGKMLEEEGNFRLAEHHYVEGLDFKSAINMFCLNNMFEDAYRVIVFDLKSRWPKTRVAQVPPNKLPIYGLNR
jgi:intraflagellar transport protein 172